MKFARAALVLYLLGCASITVVAQIRPICDVTCAPDPSGSTYGGAVAARPKLLNARGASSPVQATGGPQQVPMVLGSQSYNYVVPILSLPGRAGMDLNLNLYYNSRVWDIDTINGTATFNADRDFPSYGFRLDFGFLEYDVNNDEYILTERDGTKHALPNIGGYNSTDGTYINFNSTTKVITYKNGTTVLYSPFPSDANLSRPIQIKDTNGNYISIAYVAHFLSSSDQLIQSITDTLGRIINFHYDGSNRLSYIDQNVAVSTVDPTGVHRYVTLAWGTKYGTGQAWYNFAGFTVGAPDNVTPLNVLTGCTYANNTGYRFTYGDWGIINKIENLNNNTSTPVTRSYVSYDYPLASAGAQTDAPTYLHETISPDGLDTNTSVWTYAASKAGTGVVTAMSVTEPAPFNNVTVTNLDPATGLLSSVQRKDSSGKILQTTSYIWTTSGGANVPGSITSTLNDTGQQSSVQYSNYDAFGNTLDVKEFDFGGALLRETVTTYAPAPFTTQHILNLPTQILVKNGAGTTIARTDISYDDSGSINTNITDAASHDNSLTVHGNLSSITRYSDAAGGSGGVTRHFFYDSTGNVRTAELDCCNQKVFNFSVANQYAYPNSIVRGPSGTQFTTSGTYNFDKGLLLTSIDENSQVTGYQYDSMNRITAVTLPPQGSTSVLVNTVYDDSAASPTITKSSSPSTVTVPTTVTTMDGLGHVLRVDTKNGSTVVSSSTFAYDQLWRRKQASNPFGPSESVVNTSFSYDALSRPKNVTPASGGFTQYDYSGNTVTVTDPAGKQRKSYTDALGRLIQVDEPGVVASHIPANNYATLQTDGNFVLYDPFNNPLWSTVTYGTNASSIQMQDDANLVLYIFKWQAGVYVAPTGGTIPYDGCRVGATLFATQILASGACLESPSGRYMLLMQSDGNLFIYDRSVGQVTWAANTYGHPGAVASLQSDGNFVVYDTNGIGIWSSGTYGTFSERLDMQDDGRIIIYKSAWNSGTSTGNFNQTTIAHPACDVGTGTGWTGVLGTGSCFVSPNGRYELLMQTDGNLVLNNIGVTPAQTLWSTNTALTPLSLEVALHTTYTYDPLGHLTAVSQAAITGQSGSGQPRSYVYDGLGRLTSATTPESGAVTNYFTPLSGFVCGAGDPTLPCRTQDARGVVKNFSYDGINRIIGVQYSNTSGGADPANTPPVSYTYDTGGSGAFALDRLTKITEGPATPTPVNSHTFTYDNFGRILTDSQSIDQHTYLIRYAYNLASEITSITYPSGRVVLQNYDAIGRICAIGASGSTCTAGTRYLNSPVYNAAGETLSVTFGNSVQGAFTYNDHLQLSTLRYFKGSTEILNLGYDYTTGVPGNNGQIQKMHYYTTPGVEDQTKSENFTYDILGRLSAAQTGVVNSTSGAKTWSLQWTYDRLANRLTQSMVGGDPTLPVSQPNFTIDPATNRITNSGYTYDAAGNMTHDANAAYAYDGANRLININTSAAVYSYFGPQRFKKVLGSTTTRYIYSGSKPIAEYTGTTSPTLSTEYIYAGSKLLVTIAGSTTTYHHPDHLSNRAETNSSGTRTRTFGHLPYGDTWYETTPVDKWKFTSYERDSGTGETGMDYAMFRLYNSGQARFMSADFLAGNPRIPQSLNRYGYAGNNPTNIVDPLGLIWISFLLQFCTNTGSGDQCEYEIQSVWLDDGGGGGPLTSGSGGGSGGGDGGGGNNRTPNNITCSTVLPDGSTVGSHVNSIVNSLNDSAQVNANTDATAVAEAQTGSNPISDIFQVYSGANFKIMFKGQADASFLGDAGNFAYGAISADLGVPLSATEAVAGIYAKVAGHTDTNHPFGMDSSANQQIPAGYQATCQK
jgi:RHS repeat-associated protein